MTRRKRGCGQYSQVVFNRTKQWVGVVPIFCQKWRPGPGFCLACAKRRSDQLDEELKRELKRQPLWYSNIDQQFRRRQTDRLRKNNAVWRCFPVQDGRVFYISSVKDVLLNRTETYSLDASGSFLILDEFLVEDLNKAAQKQPKLISASAKPLTRFVRFLSQTPGRRRVSNSPFWGWKDSKKSCPNCGARPVLSHPRKSEYGCRGCGHCWGGEKDDVATMKVGLPPNRVVNFLKERGARRKASPDRDIRFYGMKPEAQRDVVKDLEPYWVKD